MNKVYPTMEWSLLNQAVNKWVFQYRLQRSFRWGLRGLLSGFGWAFILALVLIPHHSIIIGEYIILVGLSVLSGAGIGTLSGFGWFIDRKKIVQKFDFDLGLKERVSTAWELHFTADEMIDDQWRSHQFSDTLAVIKNLPPTPFKPFHFEKWALYLASGLLVLLILIGVLGSNFFQEAQTQRQVSMAIKNEEQKVQDLINQTEQAIPISPLQRQLLSAPAEEALKKLGQSQTSSQAISALNQAQQQLNSIQSPLNQAQLQSIQTAGKDLANKPASPLSEVGDSLSKGELLKAGQTLQNFDLDKLNDKQLESLANDLTQLSQTTHQQNPDLSNDLQNAAQALENGDTTQARLSLQQAGKSLQENAQNMALAQMAQNEAQTLNQGQQDIMKAANQGGQQGNQSGDNLANNSQQAGTTQMKANANSSADGSNLNDPSQTNNSTTHQQSAQNNASQDGGGSGKGTSTDDEKIYSPEHLGGQDGKQVSLPNSEKPGQQVIGQQFSDTNQSAQSRIPYLNALPNFTETYRQAITNGDAPLNLLPVIRGYFDSLEP